MKKKKKKDKECNQRIKRPLITRRRRIDAGNKKKKQKKNAGSQTGYIRACKWGHFVVSNDAALRSLLVNLKGDGEGLGCAGGGLFWKSDPVRTRVVFISHLCSRFLKKCPHRTAVTFTRLGPFMWKSPCRIITPSRLSPIRQLLQPPHPPPHSTSLQMIPRPCLSLTTDGRRMCGVFENRKLIINRWCGRFPVMAESALSDS